MYSGDLKLLDVSSRESFKYLSLFDDVLFSLVVVGTLATLENKDCLM